MFWFIEIDRGTESGTVIDRKLKAHDSYWRTGTEQSLHSVFPKVAWIAPDRTRAGFIHGRSHHQTLNHQLFVTVTADDAVSLLTDLGGSDFVLPTDGDPQSGRCEPDAQPPEQMK